MKTSIPLDTFVRILDGYTPSQLWLENSLYVLQILCFNVHPDHFHRTAWICLCPYLGSIRPCRLDDSGFHYLVYILTTSLVYSLYFGCFSFQF